MNLSEWDQDTLPIHSIKKAIFAFSTEEIILLTMGQIKKSARAI